MFEMHRTARQRRATTAAMTLGVGVALASLRADAHFRLITPGNWVVQSTDGSPQKTGPCGNEAPQMASNVVTAFRPGDTVTIQLEETVFHPGHYRVALAVNTPSELPPEPMVTAGSSQCGSTVIQQAPVFPILADGMLLHTTAFSGQQSFQVKLPTNVTCAACTLQIIEFMSSHTAPCFYHHCAKISIQDGPTDGGTGTTDAARDSAGGAGGAAGSGATGGGGTGGAGGSGGATGGSGGTAASGGSGGTGTSGGSGGTGATGGSGTGGSGTGGSGAGGGSAGSGSGATAGAAGNGTSGTAGRGGATGQSIETTGCSCRVARANARSLWGASSLATLALALLQRRRRRR